MRIAQALERHCDAIIQDGCLNTILSILDQEITVVEDTSTSWCKAAEEQRYTFIEGLRKPLPNFGVDGVSREEYYFSEWLSKVYRCQQELGDGKLDQFSLKSFTGGKWITSINDDDLLPLASKLQQVKDQLQTRAVAIKPVIVCALEKVLLVNLEKTRFSKAFEQGIKNGVSNGLKHHGTYRRSKNNQNTRADIQSRLDQLKQKDPADIQAALSIIKDYFALYREFFAEVAEEDGGLCQYLSDEAAADIKQLLFSCLKSTSTTVFNHYDVNDVADDEPADDIDAATDEQQIQAAQTNQQVVLLICSLLQRYKVDKTLLDEIKCLEEQLAQQDPKVDYVAINALPDQLPALIDRLPAQNGVQSPGVKVTDEHLQELLRSCVTFDKRGIANRYRFIFPKNYGYAQ